MQTNQLTNRVNIVHIAYLCGPEPPGGGGAAAAGVSGGPARGSAAPGPAGPRGPLGPGEGPAAAGAAALQAQHGHLLHETALDPHALEAGPQDGPRRRGPAPPRGGWARPVCTGGRGWMILRPLFDSSLYLDERM